MLRTSEKKRRFTTVIMIWISVWLVSIVNGGELTTSQIAEKALPATVVVEVTGVGTGSGAIVSEDGVVLGCFHVVDKAKSVLVKMSNGGYFPAKGFLGLNPQLDISVLKIEGKSLPYLTVGDSAVVKPGDRVVAVGSPKGLENTVSEGIVSAVRKVSEFPDDWKELLLRDGRKEEDVLIQFNAPITHGSSGGPLINASGEIIGIVVKRDPRSDADNIYFAVPVNEAKPLLFNRTVIKIEEIDFTSIGGERKRIGVGPKDLGLGSVTEKKADFVIPKATEPTYRLSPGLYSDPDSIEVIDTKDNEALVKCGGTPKRNEYRILTDGSLLFSSEDIKRKVSIAYKARPKKVAILPITNTSNLDYMTDAMRNALVTILSGYGFEISPEAEVNAIVRDEQVNVDTVLYGIGDALEPENITKLADRLNASYLVFATVGASASHGYFEQGAGAGALVLMFDGRTGKMVLTKQQNVNKDTTFSFKSQRSVREKIVRDMVDKMYREYFGVKK